MKIGFIQFSPALADLEKTMDRMDRLLKKGREADLLALPELCNSGYNFESSEQAWELAEEIENSVFLDFLISRCKDMNLFIVSGFNERDGDRLYNSSVLLGPEGFIGKYRKLHLFLNEKDHFTPGDLGLPVFDIGPCKVGMLICFDWIFPEAWRILALEGAQIIGHPSNLVLPGLAQRGVPIHALVNGLFTVTANRIGKERDLAFTGLSIVADPKGRVLYQASNTEEDVAVLDVDIRMADDKMITPRNHLLGDRRPQEYKRLTEA